MLSLFISPSLPLFNYTVICPSLLSLAVSPSYPNPNTKTFVNPRKKATHLQENLRLHASSHGTEGQHPLPSGVICYHNRHQRVERLLSRSGTVSMSRHDIEAESPALDSERRGWFVSEEKKRIKWRVCICSLGCYLSDISATNKTKSKTDHLTNHFT